MNRLIDCGKLVSLCGIVLCCTAVVHAQDLQVSPMSWDYGNVAVGTSKTKTFDLLGGWPTEVWVYVIFLSEIADDVPPYAAPQEGSWSLGAFSFNPATWTTLPRVLSVDEHLPVDVVFTPPGPGDYGVYLGILSNDSILPPGPQTFLWLEGTGLPAIQRTLTISSTGGGSVISPGEGTFQYNDGDSVMLMAKADPMYTFVGWGGGVFANVNPHSLTMDADYEVKAHFVSSLDLLYVDDDAQYDPGPGDSNLSDPRENGTVRHPFDRVQEAIEVAKRGAKVIVRPGTYLETIDLLGKRIEVNGLNTDDPNIPALPIIDGQGKDTVVRCTQREDPNCILTGLVITGGRGPLAGGILCVGSSPSIMNCLIIGNRETNTEGRGGGLYCQDSNALFVQCTIASNTGLWSKDSQPVITNSIVWGNTSIGLLADRTIQPIITYSDVANGWPGVGNLNVDPLFVMPGYWADPQNMAKVLSPLDPIAVWVHGDYHLMSTAGRWDPVTKAWVKDTMTSPCIDAGNPAVLVGAEPQPNGNRINMGAYGGTSQASLSQ